MISHRALLRAAIACEYGPANDGCGDKAGTLIVDLTTYANAFADWTP